MNTTRTKYAVNKDFKISKVNEGCIIENQGVEELVIKVQGDELETLSREKLNNNFIDMVISMKKYNAPVCNTLKYLKPSRIINYFARIDNEFDDYDTLLREAGL
ncbi:hypothetical protein J4205_01040 [Candidatus Pacearchaeota archaeon]|nr:hypothetical protein [uncultured archaeon]MBS3066383.1 hypothetical protein [Candidatus Pacearchaeota archaeon]